MAVDFSNLSLSQIVIAFIITAIALKAFSEFADFILSKLNIYHKRRSKDENITEKIAAHEKEIGELKKTCTEMREIINALKEMQIIGFSDTITKACVDVIKKGNASEAELKGINELFKIYKNAVEENDLVKNLVDRANALPILG